MSEKIQQSAEKVARWVERHDYKAFDPGDGNLSVFHPVTFNRQPLERILQQIVYRAPWNIRGLLGIKPHRSTKGTGYIAWGYLKMYARTGRAEFAERARACLNWLLENNSTGHSGYCWGNHFLFASRGGRIPKLEPTIVWSGLIGQAFLDAHEILKTPRYLEIAASICQWVKGLPREVTTSGICLSYTSQKQSSIHNSNLIGAALLARTGALTGDREAVDIATQAAQYSCARLREDGSWFYAEKGCAWIDSFHTGYNLDSLKRYSQATGDHQFDGQVSRAYEFFKRSFFEPSGRPKYYHNKTHPVDIQCAAQAIDTLTFFSDVDAEGLPLAQKVAEWTIDNMQDRDGHFYYRRSSWTVNRAPMLHWGQGTMFKALAHFLEKSNPSRNLNGEGACQTADAPGDPQNNKPKNRLAHPAQALEKISGHSQHDKKGNGAAAFGLRATAND